ncbi:hypothetical protein GZL_01246 [Streptomyces sp. 769]|nr:hypothetical protein GZL_01246 [Streptomyces sp. 769]
MRRPGPCPGLGSTLRERVGRTHPGTPSAGLRDRQPWRSVHGLVVPCCRCPPSSLDTGRTRRQSRARPGRGPYRREHYVPPSPARATGLTILIHCAVAGQRPRGSTRLGDVDLLGLP